MADIGCGDGLLSRTLLDCRPDLSIVGFDVLMREDAHIDVRQFDGRAVPLDDDAVDFAMLVDVVHHVDDQLTLLREALRVSRSGVLIKDHLKEGLLAGPTLRFMDWVGNARHGVRLPYKYLTRAEWNQLYETLGVRTCYLNDAPNLYSAPASWVFGRSLHFVAHLVPASKEGSAS